MHLKQVYMVNRIIKYPESEGAPKDYRVQLLGPQRTTQNQTVITVLTQSEISTSLPITLILCHLTEKKIKFSMTNTATENATVLYLRGW